MKPKPKFPLCSEYGLTIENLVYWAGRGDDGEIYAQDVEQALAKAEGNRKVLEGNLEACLDINKQLRADVKFWSEKAKELGYGQGARRMKKSREVGNMKPEIQAKKPKICPICGNDWKYSPHCHHSQSEVICFEQGKLSERKRIVAMARKHVNVTDLRSFGYLSADELVDWLKSQLKEE